ncbi:hypothetical protein [Maridesulfovibrio sp.]|uniref:hypothetical protein n=1 Tax=Maridesulfovibrio sp. TaxID=2795000 RepID=UPI0039F12C81
MLSLDGFEKAWNVLEWNLSFSISDGVTLVIAAATTALALLTYRIQREQKRILERQVRIDEIKFRREHVLLKRQIQNSIYNVSEAVVKREDIKGEWVELLNNNEDLIKHIFSQEMYEFVDKLVAFAEGVDSFNTDEDKEKYVEMIKGDFFGIVVELFEENKF